MNIQQDVPHDHNADKRFKSFNDKLDQIEAAVFSAQALLNSHNTAIYKALCITLDLAYEFASQSKEDEDDDWQLLKDFLIFHEERWSAKCETNIFHGLVSIAFNQIGSDGLDINSAPTLSKYRAVLRYAFDNELTSQELLKRLEEKTIAEVYQDAISQTRFDPIDKYLEDKDESFERASKELLGQASLPNANFTADIPKPVTALDFATAIVKINGNGFDVVGFVENETEEQIQAKVISLVPEEAKHARRKLIDKNLYQLYVCCDLFKRFTPNMATLRSWNKAHKAAQLPELAPKHTQEELDNYIQALNARNKADANDQNRLIQNVKQGQTSTVTKFMMLNVLDFKAIENKLVASSLTTHPSTPYLEFQFDIERPKLQSLMPLMIKDMDSASFSNTFLESGEWSIKRKQAGLVASSPTNTAAQKLYFQDYSSLANWRTLDSSLKSIGRYSLDRITLDRLSRWKSDYAETPKFTRKSFQSILVIEDKGNTIDLVFPNDKNERRTLGTSSVTVLSNYQSRITHQRYLDIKQISELIQLALDYRIHFGFELLEGYQGVSALRFHCVGLLFEASITIPLLLSVKGNPVEITK